MLWRALAKVYNAMPVRWQRRVLDRAHPRFLVGVAVVCTDASAVLLAMHRFGRPQWRLPGGFLRQSESVFDCARREIREELGCDLTDIELIDVIAGYPTHRVEIVVSARLLGKPTLRSAELREIAFFDRASLPGIRPDQRRGIELVLARYSGADHARPL